MAVTLHADDADALPAYAVAGDRGAPARRGEAVAGAASTASGHSAARRGPARPSVSSTAASTPNILLVRGVRSAVAVHVTDDETLIEPDETGDVCGHGTACAGIIRSLAPDCELVSVRVLGEGFVGSGPALIEGLRWAVEQGFDVINMSLSTTKERFVADLHALTDAAYFRRSLIVASAHNMPVRSYPWRFASVVSVASHDLDDPLAYVRNPEPPVEFYARGVEVDVAWSDGSTLRASGNSFATPHISGICALIRSKHPELTPPEVKTLLGLTATNAEAAG